MYVSLKILTVDQNLLHPDTHHISKGKTKQNLRMPSNVAKKGVAIPFLEKILNKWDCIFYWTNLNYWKSVKTFDTQTGKMLKVSHGVVNRLSSPEMEKIPCSHFLLCVFISILLITLTQKSLKVILTNHNNKTIIPFRLYFDLRIHSEVQTLLGILIPVCVFSTCQESFTLHDSLNGACTLDTMLADHSCKNILSYPGALVAMGKYEWDSTKGKQP